MTSYRPSRSWRDGWNNTDVTSANPRDWSTPVPRSRSKRKRFHRSRTIGAKKTNCDRSTKTVAFSCADESKRPIASNDRLTNDASHSSKFVREQTAAKRSPASDKQGKLEQSNWLSKIHDNSANQPKLTRNPYTHNSAKTTTSKRPVTSRDESNLFFRVVNYRYNQGSSLAITTNKGVASWPSVLADDEVLAGAILDRLLHSATVLNIQGRSYRLKELDEQLSQGSPPQQPLRQHNGGAGADDGKPTETRS